MTPNTNSMNLIKSHKPMMVIGKVWTQRNWRKKKKHRLKYHQFFIIKTITETNEKRKTMWKLRWCRRSARRSNNIELQLGDIFRKYDEMNTRGTYASGLHLMLCCRRRNTVPTVTATCYTPQHHPRRVLPRQRQKKTIHCYYVFLLQSQEQWRTVKNITHRQLPVK